MGDEIVKTPVVPNVPAVVKAPAAVSPPVVPNAPAVAKVPVVASSPVVVVPKSKKWIFVVVGIVAVLAVLGILVYFLSDGSVQEILGIGQGGALADAYYDFNVPSNCYGDKFESDLGCDEFYRCASRKLSNIVRGEDIEELMDQMEISGNSAVVIYLNNSCEKIHKQK